MQLCQNVNILHAQFKVIKFLWSVSSSTYEAIIIFLQFIILIWLCNIYKCILLGMFTHEFEIIMYGWQQLWWFIYDCYTDMKTLQIRHITEKNGKVWYFNSRGTGQLQPHPPFFSKKLRFLYHNKWYTYVLTTCLILLAASTWL